MDNVTQRIDTAITNAGPRWREATRIACWAIVALLAIRGARGYYQDTWIPDAAVTAALVALLAGAATQDLWGALHRKPETPPDH